MWIEVTETTPPNRDVMLKENKPNTSHRHEVSSIMNKKQLVQSIALKADINQTIAHKALTEILTQIQIALMEGEKIFLPQFGTFELRYKLPRQGRNPQTGEPIDIPGVNQPSFKPSLQLKAFINRE